LAIVDLGIFRLEMIDRSAKVLRGKLEQHRKAVLDESNARPYGRKDKMATAAHEFAQWSDVIIGDLSTASYTEDTSVELLKILILKSLVKVSDYEDARQILEGKKRPKDLNTNVGSYDEARHIAWTIKILAVDLGILKDLANPNAVLNPKWDADRPAIEAVMAKFETGLKLELPATQSQKIEDNLDKALQVIGDYEPSEFQKDLQELAKILKIPVEG
jgi:hypothetical protein